jgi:NAD(P)H-flavin reductase
LGFAGLAPRDYSIANQPTDENLEFHIRVRGPGGVAEHLRATLAEGDAVSLWGPFGEAYLRPGHSGPILAIAGGTGMVPAKSIIGAALASAVDQPVFLYLGARSEGDLYGEADFLAWQDFHSNFKFVPVLSEPGPGSVRLRGNVTDAVAQDFTDLAGFKCYVAGPPPMVAEAARWAAGAGAKPSDIHADPFVSGDHHSASAE